MWIIYKEDSFGDMVLQLGFSLYGGSHIDTTSKSTKKGEVLSLGCNFINCRSNFIRCWKGIVKLDSMVQGIWSKFISNLVTVIIDCIELSNIL